MFQPTSALGQVGDGQPQLVPGYCLLLYCSWRSFFGAETRVNTGRDLTAPHRTIPHPPSRVQTHRPLAMVAAELTPPRHLFWGNAPIALTEVSTSVQPSRSFPSSASFLVQVGGTKPIFPRSSRPDLGDHPCRKLFSLFSLFQTFPFHLRSEDLREILPIHFT